MKKILLLGMALFAMCVGSAQDIHYSQFFNSPLNLSPALTGVFNGDKRISANYKRQWKSVPVDYRTFTVAADMKFNRLEASSGTWNAGILLDYDRAGDLNLSLGLLAFSGSYSYFLSSRSSITPALSLGIAQRRLSTDGIRTGNQWDGEIFNPSIAPEITDNDNRLFFDISAGLNYRWQKSYRQHIDIGAGLHHINGAGQSFNDNVSYDSDLARRLTIYGLTSFMLADKLDLLLNGMASFQSPHQEIVLNAQGKIYFNRNRGKEVALYLGGGLRLDDAFYPMIGLQYGPWYGAFSYDINTSDFDVATDQKGGPEFSLMYRFTRAPLAECKFCPIY